MVSKAMSWGKVSRVSVDGRRTKYFWRLKTNDQRIFTKGRIAVEFFMGGNSMWQWSASTADKWVVGVALCTYCRTSTRCCLLAGTAEGSIVFSRLRQCASPTNTLFLEPAWVSPLNGFSSDSAVLDGPYVAAAHKWFNRIRLEAPMCTRNYVVLLAHTNLSCKQHLFRSSGFERVNVCHSAKFLEDRSNRFSRRRPYWISKIRNFTVDMLEMVNMRHQIEFHGDPSNRCQDTAI